MLEAIVTFVSEFWDVLREMSPYLLFGFFVAGLLSVAVSPEFVEHHLGGRKIMPIIKAALFGIPLPLCSCGVIPVAASLRKHGASRGATIAFLLSTPQTGVDSISVTFSLLGPVFAVFRPLAALACGIFGGTLVTIFEPNQKGQAETREQCEDACCSPKSGRGWIGRALHYGFVTLPQDIGRPLLIGVVIAGLIAAIVPEDFFREALGTGIAAMLVMMLLGIPVYVCATASVPIAVALIAKGVSPGAALVFLMTGPATNVAAIATIWKILGKRTAVIYLCTVAVTAIGAGLLLDYIFAVKGVTAAPGMPWMLPEFVKIAAAVVLLGVLAFPLLRRSEKPVYAPVDEQGKTTTLSIAGMTCSHCAETIERGLKECPGVESAKVNLKSHNATVSGKNYDISLLRQRVEELGYKVEKTENSTNTERTEKD